MEVLHLNRTLAISLIARTALAVELATLPLSHAHGAPGVVLDGSFGPSGALNGPNFIITAGMGRQVGTNLFHSFSDFNLTSSQSATFTAQGSTGPISNILARVTGGSPSSIDGTITSQIAGANLFLLNPAGVMFGPDAQVNLTGSFIVGTPDFVRLENGGKFNTSLGNDSQLTTAEVSAFGFLSVRPHPVSFAGTQLSVASGTGLHVIAGDITLDQGASLAAPSGNLTLFSAGIAGEVPFSLATPGSGFASAITASFGNITMQNQSSVAIDGAGGGSVVIRGGRITVDHSTVSSFNTGTRAGGDISIQADALSVQNGSLIGADAAAGATAPAGNIDVNVSGNAAVSGNSQVSDNTEVAANSGAINFVAGGTVTLSNAGELIDATDGAGNSGSISLRAANLDIHSQGSGISGLSNGAGNAGTIEVNVTGSISMSDSALIDADTYGGAGGNIMIHALQLSIADLSVISANTAAGGGNGGQINVNTGALAIEGTGELPLVLNQFLLGFTGITAEAISSVHNSGSIAVTTGILSMDNAAIISTLNIGNGNGGPISINCEKGYLSNQSQVSSGSFANAGAVHITANSFTLSSNSSVNASAAVNGGDITIRSSSLVALFDSNIQSYAGFDKNVNAAGGTGGNILIDPTFVILDNSFISANDLAPLGNDGNISNLADFFFINNSFLHATGTIQTTPPDLDLAASLVGLPDNLIDAKSRLRERCASSINHEFSSFIVVGRGGTESSPEELQPDFGLPDQ